LHEVTRVLSKVEGITALDADVGQKKLVSMGCLNADSHFSAVKPHKQL
jgi:hypothetical protein